MNEYLAPAKGDDGKEFERAMEKPAVDSMQPRFKSGVKPDQSYFESLFYIKTATKDLVERAYKPDSRKRDEWLRDFVRLEPNLRGALATVVAIDTNRGWRMIGGKNQVSKYTLMFHNIQAAPGLVGWRPSVSALSQAFWGSDMGGVLEFGRQGRNGPIRSLFVVDPAKCKLTGSSTRPLAYHPRGKSRQFWRWKDFIRVVAMPSTDEKYNGLGYCAVGGCTILAQLMIAVYEHDAEQLGAKAPRGLMLLLGISQKQWKEAMKARDAELTGGGYDYFNALAVIASATQEIDAKLIALSQLPVSFELREWLDMLMYGYALQFQYDPTEFWPVQFGALGRGDETRIQHEKATGKGRLAFPLTLQEQILGFLPDTLDFKFDQRDEQGDLLHASVNKAWADVAETLAGSSLVDLDEGRLLLADYGVIPRSWTTSSKKSSTDQQDDEYDENLGEVEEKDDIQSGKADDVGRMGHTRKAKVLREILLESPEIWRAAKTFGDEPIVQYSWPANTMITLWPSGDELLRPKMWKGF